MIKLFKNSIFTFILGAFIFSGITGTVAYSYAAKQVGFTPNDKNWKVDNVEDAINSLKNSSLDLSKVTISSSDILSGKKAYDSSGNLITGTYNDSVTTYYVLPSPGYIYVQLPYIASKYNYFSVKKNGDQGANCSTYTTDVDTKLYDVSDNTKYSTKYEGSTNYRLAISKSGNGWCNFYITYSN